MANEHAVPEAAQRKTHGDKLDKSMDDVLDKGTGLTQDTSNKSTKPTPQQEPLK